MDNQKNCACFIQISVPYVTDQINHSCGSFCAAPDNRKIKQCKNEDDRLRAFGAGLLLEYGLRQYGYTQTIPWDHLQQQSWSRPDKHGLCNR